MVRAKGHRLGDSFQVVLIDEHLVEIPPALERRHVAFVRGNPTRDETLERANLDEARYAIVLTKSGEQTEADNRNVAIALAIEGRAPDVYTVVECNDF